MKTHLLVVDDQVPITTFLRKTLESEGYSVGVATNGAQALEAIRETIPDLVLLDLMLPDMSGLDVLREARSAFSQMCIVMMTAYGEVETAVAAMRAGAQDFITKPFNLEHLLLTIRRSLKASTDARRIYTLQRQHRDAPRFSGMVMSESPAMIDVYSTVRKLVAGETTTVLLQGESGTGKDLIANLIHNSSNRQAQPFLEINCAAMPPTLLESELFGHEKGAFTDASQQKPGLFELANHGTIFLDEIGEMGVTLQSKLLQVLEKHRFKRVGGLQDINVDVRIISATNRNLTQMVQAGIFREDLYYRLNVVPLVIPPLRERPEDIAALAEHFLRLFTIRFRKSFRGISASARDCLLAYSWPGNIRELRNAIERAVLLGDGEELECEHLGLGADPQAPGLEVLTSLRSALAGNFPPDFVLEDVLQALDRKMIDRALLKTDGNQTQAAQMLGLHRDKLRYRLKRYQDEE